MEPTEAIQHCTQVQQKCTLFAHFYNLTNQCVSKGKQQSRCSNHFEEQGKAVKVSEGRIYIVCIQLHEYKQILITYDISKREALVDKYHTHSVFHLFQINDNIRLRMAHQSLLCSTRRYAPPMFEDLRHAMELSHS
jgi:hypothetical protein